MTRKKRQPVKSIEKLSDDLRGHRALKGETQRISVAVATIDRWIQKAEVLERQVNYWKGCWLATREQRKKEEVGVAVQTKKSP